MTDLNHDQNHHPDMAAHRVFKVLSSAAGEASPARLGRLALPGRRAVETPSFTGVASRGVIPHLTPEVLEKYTSMGSAYIALEDFVEKKDPAIFKKPVQNGARRLQSFTAFPKDITTIMAARRNPAVVTPQGNTAKRIHIFTSSGFDTITVPKYAADIETLRPDIAIPLADLPHSSSSPVHKKALRMAERTEEWVDQFMDLIGEKKQELGTAVFAPVLPLEHSIQWSYLKRLAEDLVDQIDGLVIYDVSILPDLATYKALADLPKLSLDVPKTPHDILRQMALGIDMVMVPFINSASDAGVALTFSLDPSSESTPSGIQPLGIDLWSEEHKTAVAPLTEECPCYACTRHHRAYINHLLNAREMLGWNLLQIHNHHVISEFMSAIRKVLSTGPEELERLTRIFSATYDPELPAGTGDRPRVRGYQFKSEASQDKFNKPGWKDLNGSATTPALGKVEGQ